MIAVDCVVWLKTAFVSIEVVLSVQVTDWDDRMRIVKWVDVVTSPDSKQPEHRPAKKKVPHDQRFHLHF